MQFSARVNANSHFFRIIILTSVLFLICPLISILVAYWVLLRENKERCIWLFAVLMACYISFVNISKSISSDPDLPWYTEQYLEAVNLSYIQYVMGFGLNGKGRELFFPTFNYLVYFIAGDNVALYRFIHSLVCYILVFFAIIRFATYLKIDSRKIVIPLLWYTCFPWIFTYSQTILRQFLACSFLLWICVEYFFYDKKMIIPFACMVLSHTSTILFFPLVYLPFFHKELTRRSIVFYLIGILLFLFIQPIAEFLGMFVAGSDTILSYALKRASSDTTFELPPLGLSKILFLILEIGVLLYYYIQIKVKQIDASVLKRHIGLINSIIILNLFILINIHQLELSNRLFTYSAVLSVFPLCYLVQKYRLKENVITLFFVIMQLLLVLYFMNSIYIYEIPFGILINPFHLLFQ